ncbi:MAG: hypothetical protein NXH85_12910 [Pseudomonadaceae bacterium]|nr:hypothetical protein [Pseudomonadaceae bacterium]
MTSREHASDQPARSKLCTTLPIALVLALNLLAGCTTSVVRTVDMTPPESIANLDEANLLDVGVAVFDANVPEDYDERIEQLIEPEIRRAESYYLPYTLKNLLQSTGNWGAVRVVPRPSYAVDVWVNGRIEQSNGESMQLTATVTDATGELWFEKTYDALASRYAYGDSVPRDVDPFQAIYKELADDMLAHRQSLDEEDIRRIRLIAQMQFARDFAPDAFSDHVVENDKGDLVLNRLPADNDPMLERVESVRQREYLFIDTLDEYYDNFHAGMFSPYQEWRRASYDEAIAYKELKAAARSRTIAGTVAVLGGLAATQADNGYTQVSGLTSIVGGAILLKGAIERRNAAQIHADVLRELSEGTEAEITPYTLSLENESLRLQGTVDEQYTQLRRVLKKLYFEELGLTPPDTPPEEASDSSSEPEQETPG